MCIRDSGYAIANDAHAPNLGAVEGDAADDPIETEHDRVAPVSYTHLTLPTSDLV